MQKTFITQAPVSKLSLSSKILYLFNLIFKPSTNKYNVEEYENIVKKETVKLLQNLRKGDLVKIPRASLKYIDESVYELKSYPSIRKNNNYVMIRIIKDI